MQIRAVLVGMALASAEGEVGGAAANSGLELTVGRSAQGSLALGDCG